MILTRQGHLPDSLLSSIQYILLLSRFFDVLLSALPSVQAKRQAASGGPAPAISETEEMLDADEPITAEKEPPVAGTSGLANGLKEIEGKAGRDRSGNASSFMSTTATAQHATFMRIT